MAPVEAVWWNSVIVLLGGGTLGATIKVLIDKRVPSVKEEADRVALREDAEDKSRTAFREELRDEIKELRKLHAECQKDREHDRVELWYLRGQVEILRGSLVVVPKAASAQLPLDLLAVTPPMVPSPPNGS